MSIAGIFNTAGSAMNAQSIRLNTTASNIANAETASSSAGNTYRGRHAVFSAIQNGMMPNAGSFGEQEQSMGVQVMGVVESDAPLQRRYEPNHPSADNEGYVFYPNVNVVEEMANMISASRSFQMNVEVMNSAKQMAQRVLQLGQ